jgi:hypothetical protein
MQLQELFENLQLNSSSQQDNIESSISADNIVQHKIESPSHQRSSLGNEAYESILEDEEIAKLITYFVNRGSQQTTQPSTTECLLANAPSVALPPAVRFCRANRKAVLKLPA